MNSFLKTTISAFIALGVFVSAQASAEYRADYRPDRCSTNHDHRSHDSSYYDYYQKDKYYRQGSYRGGRDNYDRHDRYDRGNNYGRGYDNRNRRGRYDRRRARSRVVNRETYNTRFRAHIVLVEEIYWTRSGREQLVCSVLVKGPEAHYVKNRRLRRIANRDCSRRARIQYI